jgi:predicted nucleotidyltransferase
MDASPLLVRVLAALRDRKLEAVLIGNAAAALHGAPVTTLDFDFLFRETTTNLTKLKQVAKDCDAMILRPFYPVSKLYRVVNDDLGLQADFMPMIHGIRSFEGVRARATQRMIGGFPLIVASLDDIIASKKAAGRERDLAVLPVLEQTRRTSVGQAAAPKGKRRGSR